MKKLLIAFLPLALATAAVAQGLNAERQTQQEEAYSTYFRCINVYAGRYVKSEALVADVVDELADLGILAVVDQRQMHGLQRATGARSTDRELELAQNAVEQPEIGMIRNDADLERRRDHGAT